MRGIDLPSESSVNSRSLLGPYLMTIRIRAEYSSRGHATEPDAAMHNWVPPPMNNMAIQYGMTMPAFHPPMMASNPQLQRYGRDSSEQVSMRANSGYSLPPPSYPRVGGHVDGQYVAAYQGTGGTGHGGFYTAQRQAPLVDGDNVMVDGEDDEDDDDYNDDDVDVKG